MSTPEIQTLRNEEIAPLLRSVSSYKPDGHCLSAPDWLSIIATAYPVETVFFYAVRNQGRQVAGQLPAYYSKHGGTLFGLRYGLRAETEELARRLCQAARQFAGQARLSAIDLGIEDPSQLGEPETTEATSFVFDLTGCRREEDLPQIFSQSGRRAIRTARRGEQIVLSGPEHFDEAYSVYRNAMHAKRVRVHSEAFLRAIDQKPDGQLTPLVCYEREESLAAAFLLTDRHQGAYLYGGTTPRGVTLRSSSLLYFHMILLCLQRGLPLFDAGESASGSGTFEFKRRLGGQPKKVHYLRQQLGSQGSALASLTRLPSKLLNQFDRISRKTGILSSATGRDARAVASRRII